MKAAFVSAMLLALLPACASAGSSPASNTGLPWVELAGQRYEVELATDDHSRAQGLMYRTQLPAGRGMLFIHDRQEWQAYWMKNTRIPLDILYFDSQLRLVSQQRNVPPCPPRSDCPPYPSEGPARYVLELNAGHAARLQLQNGQRLILGPGIPPAN
ncbi:DUF192 domain-containing protein [Stenotrophomonas ginsengisoli]|nr:DUF192 domain-containing protein [Stenotrophomonas ginsengisoli]